MRFIGLSSTNANPATVPNSTLVCKYCGFNDTGEAMQIKYESRSRHRAQRTAYHQSCEAAYKLRLKALRDGRAGDVFVFDKPTGEDVLEIRLPPVAICSPCPVYVNPLALD